MEIITFFILSVSFVIKFFIVCNLLFAFLYVIGPDFAEGASEAVSLYAGCFASLILVIFFGVSIFTGNYVFDKFNGFSARLLMILLMGGYVMMLNVLP